MAKNNGKSKKQQVADLLMANPGVQMTAAEIAEKTGIDRGYVNTILNYLRAESRRFTWGKDEKGHQMSGVHVYDESLPDTAPPKKKRKAKSTPKVAQTPTQTHPRSLVEVIDASPDFDLVGEDKRGRAVFTDADGEILIVMANVMRVGRRALWRDA